MQQWGFVFCSPHQTIVGRGGSCSSSFLELWGDTAFQSTLCQQGQLPQNRSGTVTCVGKVGLRCIPSPHHPQASHPLSPSLLGSSTFGGNRKNSLVPSPWEESESELRTGCLQGLVLGRGWAPHSRGWGGTWPKPGTRWRLRYTRKSCSGSHHWAPHEAITALCLYQDHSFHSPENIISAADAVPNGQDQVKARVYQLGKRALDRKARSLAPE